MYLTAQRVVSSGNESGINGFLYEHGAGVVTWDPPPDPASGAVDAVGGRRARAQPHLRGSGWQQHTTAAAVGGVIGDMRFGLHMASTYAETWKEEATRLLTACRMTLECHRSEGVDPERSRA